MKKQYSAIIIAVFLFACGGNAENTVKEEPTAAIVLNETLKEIEEEESPVEMIIQEAVAKEEVDEKIIETIPTKIEEPIVEPEITVEPTIIKDLIPEPVLLKADHSNWDGLTQKYVDATGKVNYKGMKAELSKIKIYLEHLKNNSPKKEWSKNEKLAYWINLYNASTVYLIASNYPVASITKINGGKPWDKKFVKSGTKVYTLNEVENTIVRPQFKDPRIHAVLNCAAVSCPKLLNRAYFPEKLNSQLDKQTRAWVNDKTKNVIAPQKVKISQIFDWYATDFAKSGGVLKFINKYLQNKIIIVPEAKITYFEYNWELND